MNIPLKESILTPGHVYKIESPKFGVAVVACVRVPHPERAFRMQFAPLGADGISGQTLYWDSVRDDLVLETWPNIRAYLEAVNDPPAVPEKWEPDARGFVPTAAAGTESVETPAGPAPVAVTKPPATRPLPAGCLCDPKNWPAAPFTVPPPCASYTEEDGKCIMCEHLQECHH